MKHQPAEVLAELRSVADSLNKVPTRAEFVNNVKSGQLKIECTFGTYNALLQAAGLMTFDERRLKRNKNGLTNQIFSRDIEAVLAERPPPVVVEQPRLSRTLVIPDTHFPFENKRVLEAAYRFAEIHKPKRIVQVGDLYDMYCHTKFPRSQNLFNPAEEEKLSRAGAETMWKELQKASPGADCVQLTGNHDIRPLKRTLESLPSLEHVVKKYLDVLMTFEGVTLIPDPRQEYIVEGIEFIHGHYGKLGAHRDYALMNAVCGHIHTGGAVFKRIRGQTLWELNCGLAGDPEAKALGYTPQKITHWTPGFGWIDEYGPRFIPV